jgi:AcrR family transcriptional regulator
MAAETRAIPGQARARATLDLIVEAAAQLLEESGFDGYNTNAVAARAKVSVGSLYRYFADKEAILAALAEREADSLVAQAKMADGSHGAREAIIHLIDAAVRHRLQRPELARALDHVQAWADGRSGAAVSGSTLERIVGAALARPGLARPLSARIAESDLAAILRAVVDAAVARGEYDAALISRRVRAAVFGYLDRAQTA